MYRTNRALEEMTQDIKERIGADEEPGVIVDVAQHGADTGWGGFTYTSDCVEFYEEHASAIWEMAQEMAEEMGYSNVPEFVGSFNRSDMADTEDGFKNLLAWFALEEVCRLLEEDLEGCVECAEYLNDYDRETEDGLCAKCRVDMEEI